MTIDDNTVTGPYYYSVTAAIDWIQTPVTYTYTFSMQWKFDPSKEIMAQAGTVITLGSGWHHNNVKNLKDNSIETHVENNVPEENTITIDFLEAIDIGSVLIFGEEKSSGQI